MIAASTLGRSGAVIVTSAASSGVLQMSRRDSCFRTSMYSGMYLPAWRRNQTGVRSTGSLRHARTKRPAYPFPELFFSCVILTELSGLLFEL